MAAADPSRRRLLRAERGWHASGGLRKEGASGSSQPRLASAGLPWSRPTRQHRCQSGVVFPPFRRSAVRCRRVVTAATAVATTAPTLFSTLATISVTTSTTTTIAAAHRVAVAATELSAAAATTAGLVGARR
jgi:hypothetical protein